MELVIRMKTVTRVLLFLAATIVWLVVLVLLNQSYLRVDELVIIMAAGLLAVATTVGLAFALHT